MTLLLHNVACCLLSFMKQTHTKNHWVLNSSCLYTIIRWPPEERDATNVKTQNSSQSRGPTKASTLRLCEQWSKGVWGLVSITAMIQDETRSIHKCIRKMTPQDELLPERLRQLKTDGDEQEGKEISYKTKWLTLRKTQWLKTSDRKDSTDPLTGAVQDQAVRNTRLRGPKWQADNPTHSSRM